MVASLLSGPVDSWQELAPPVPVYALFDPSVRIDACRSEALSEKLSELNKRTDSVRTKLLNLLNDTVHFFESLNDEEFEQMRSDVDQFRKNLALLVQLKHNEIAYLSKEYALEHNELLERLSELIEFSRGKYHRIEIIDGDSEFDL